LWFPNNDDDEEDPEINDNSEDFLNKMEAFEI
jgi:hypothetical protein